MNKIKLSIFILIISNIYSVNSQIVNERERLIGESYYRWDYNKGLLPSDSTIYFYNNQNNIVIDPYKTYLKKSFDSIEAFIAKPTYEYIEDKFVLWENPIYIQYPNEMLQFDTAINYTGNFDSNSFDYKKINLWSNDKKVRTITIECNEINCENNDTTIIIYDYNTENKISKRRQLDYNFDSNLFDTSNLYYEYSYSNNVLMNSKKVYQYPGPKQTYISDYYFYDEQLHLQKYNSYNVSYLLNINSDSLHKTFTYNDDKLINFKCESQLTDSLWTAISNLDFQYSESVLTSINGIFEQAPIVIEYYSGDDGKTDSIIKHSLPYPWPEGYKEFFIYDTYRNLIEYNCSGNSNHYAVNIKYTYDKFNRILSDTRTFYPIYEQDYIQKYIYKYTPNGNIAVVEFQGAYYGDSLSNKFTRHYYYETIPLTSPAVIENLTILVFPNPTNNTLNITVTGFNNSAPLTLNIFNVQGQNILNNANIDGVTGISFIDISNLASGVYFVEVNDRINSSRQKVVIY